MTVAGAASTFLASGAVTDEFTVGGTGAGLGISRRASIGTRGGTRGGTTGAARGAGGFGNSLVGVSGRAVWPDTCGTTRRFPQYRHFPAAPASSAPTHIGPPHEQSK